MALCLQVRRYVSQRASVFMECFYCFSMKFCFHLMTLEDWSTEGASFWASRGRSTSGKNCEYMVEDSNKSFHSAFVFSGWYIFWNCFIQGEVIDSSEAEASGIHFDIPDVRIPLVWCIHFILKSLRYMLFSFSFMYASIVWRQLINESMIYEKSCGH